MFSRGRRAKTLGWKADKYAFEVHVRTLYNLLPGTRACQLTLRRGSKTLKTKTVEASKGECAFDETLETTATLFVNPKNGEYESKPALITVKEVMSPTKSRLYAEVKIDLMDF